MIVAASAPHRGEAFAGARVADRPREGRGADLEGRGGSRRTPPGRGDAAADLRGSDPLDVAPRSAARPAPLPPFPAGCPVRRGATRGRISTFPTGTAIMSRAGNSTNSMEIVFINLRLPRLAAALALLDPPPGGGGLWRAGRGKLRVLGRRGHALASRVLHTQGGLRGAHPGLPEDDAGQGVTSTSRTAPPATSRAPCWPACRPTSSRLLEPDVDKLARPGW